MSLPIVEVITRVRDRVTYLQRPDLGRLLDDGDRDRLSKLAPADGCDLSLIVADGLSAQAAQTHAPRLLRLLVPRVREMGFSLAPIVIARQARVALQDDVGQTLRARCAVILLGERPGLGAADSLGAYLVFAPRVGNTDANRNCISNIRPVGLTVDSAVEALAWLIGQCLTRRISGIELKDDRRPIAARQRGAGRAIGEADSP